MRNYESPPRNPKEEIANRLFFVRVVPASLVMAITGFVIYYYFANPAISGSTDALRLTQAQTAAFFGSAVFAFRIFTHCPFNI